MTFPLLMQVDYPINNAPVDLLSAHFTGRTEELDFLGKSLRIPHSCVPSRCAIHGMPGIGKTQLLLQFVKSCSDQNRYPHIFWISATNVDKLNHGISGILDLIGHPDRHLPDQTAKLTAARLWLETSSGGDWLLVFDNVHGDTLEFLRVHLPLRNERGNIIFTTRSPAVAEALVEGQHPILGLQAMELRETTNLLFKDAGIDVEMVMPSPLGQADELVKSVGRLPLAVAQAASFMKETYTTVENMLELYKKHRKINVIRWENVLTPYEAWSIAGAFSDQLNELNQQSRDIGNLLKFLSFLDPELIPVVMIVDGAKELRRKAPTQGHADVDTTEPFRVSPEFDSLITLILSPTKFQMAITKLQNLSLVERRSLNGVSSLWIHDLIQFLVQEDAKKEGNYEEWLQSSWSLVYGLLCLIKDPKLPQWWVDCETLIPHLQTLNNAWNDAAGVNLEVSWANFQIAEYLCSRGRYVEAEVLFDRVLEEREKQLGSTHSDTLTSLSGLATVLYLQGRYEEAEALHKRALDEREKCLGTSHSDTLLSMDNLALVYSAQGRYTEAEALHKRALEGREKLLGADHLDTLTSMNNLAVVYSSQERYGEAEVLHKQALIGCEKLLGPDHPNTIMSMNNLAFNYSSLERFDEAEELHKRTLERSKKVLGGGHPDTFMTMNNLALVYDSQGRYDEAEKLLRQTLGGCEKHLGTDHPNTLTSVENLAHVYSSQGRCEEAEALHKRTLEGRRKFLGDDHPDTLLSIDNLAELYLSQGRNNEAEALRERETDHSDVVVGRPRSSL